ncbi:MAG: 30S ribosomal protein S21 [Candidatus Marinimicrobia bacterium]|nr:30S ribosomal protein S21 [Candidatus Neomarinimicrobiota bacterium]
MATIVRKKPGESDDKLIAKFRKKVQYEQLLTEIKEREYYKKPSVKKKERLAESRRRKRRSW